MLHTFSSRYTALQATPEGEHHIALDILLKTGIGVNARPAHTNTRTALEAATSKGDRAEAAVVGPLNIV